MRYSLINCKKRTERMHKKVSASSNQKIDKILIQKRLFFNIFMYQIMYYNNIERGEYILQMNHM